MSGYAQMRPLWLHREYYAKSPTTGQKRLQRYDAIPFRGSIAQVSQSDVNSADRRYNKSAYILTTYYRGVKKDDKVLDGNDTYTVQFVDRERQRGPITVRIERVIVDG